MVYVPKTWQDKPSTATPLRASDLNHIEQGVAAAAVTADVGTPGSATGDALRAAFVTPKALRQVSSVRHAVRIDVTKLRAVNSNAPMTIPTYDGGNQLTHSSVVFDPEGWGQDTNGKSWRYWMSATPYAAGNTAVENPSIFVANDPGSVGGTNGWQVPAGLTNPIEAFPGGAGFNSDCDIEWGPDGTLYCFWRQYLPSLTGAEENICVRSSTDGINWSAKTTLITNSAAVRRPLAPSVIWDGNQWNMWAVDLLPSPNTLLRYVNTSANPKAGTWTGPVAVTLTGLPNYPASREPWHIDVNKWGDELHMLINDTDINASGANGSLFFASSDDGGLSFTCGSTPVIGRRQWAWDNSMYRSSAIPAMLGDEWGYEIIYAAYSSGPAYFLGHTFAGFDLHKRQTSTALGPVHGIASLNAVNILASRLPIAPFTFGDAWQRADAASLGSAESGQAWTVQAGVPGVASRQAYATTATNTKAVLTGTADGYHEVTVPVLGASGQAWLMFRGTDASNYWRLGFSSGTWGLNLQKIVAAAATTISPSWPIYGPGVRIGVLCSGSNLTIFANGVPVDTTPLTDSFNATGTLVGFQTADTATRFGPIYSRALVAGA